MKLYIKQRVFSWRDRFSVYDESGREKYFAEGEIFSFGRKLHLLSSNEKELALISQRLFTFLHRYCINCRGRDIGEVVKHFTLFTQKYSVEGLGWDVEGDFFAHDYVMSGGGRTIVRVQKAWFTWGDAYEIDIADGIDEVAALSVVLAIDAILEDASN